MVIRKIKHAGKILDQMMDLSGALKMKQEMSAQWRHIALKHIDTRSTKWTY